MSEWCGYCAAMREFHREGHDMVCSEGHDHWRENEADFRVVHANNCAHWMDDDEDKPMPCTCGAYKMADHKPEDE